MPEELELFVTQGRPVSLCWLGSEVHLGPLGIALLQRLADSQEPVAREDLLEALDLNLQELYRLVYRVRQSLGPDSVLQVGSGRTRRGKRYGFSGYRLALTFRRREYRESG